MKVAVLCEFSGTVRDAFIRRGHEAVSYDILPSEKPGPHVQGDCLAQDISGFDLAIAFPPCTHLANSGAKHFKKKIADGRQQQGIDFFMAMTGLPCQKIAIENPVGIMSRVYRKPDQIVHPWQFGHDQSKTTCLWLAALPKLTPTSIVAATYSCKCGANFHESLGKYGCPSCLGDGVAVLGRGHKVITKSGKILPKWYSSANARERSRTFQGIAEAMAEQWGG